ncbi:Signal transduction histidine kinase [Alteromonadaceae bacterium Bs31]|nr:Signal transduction histidine kinase [Alteromonadaceae bacterium Bs31]
MQQLELLPESDRINNLYLYMLGPQLHTLMEWCAILCAFFTAAIAFSHFRLTGNMVTPVIGLSLVFAALMDIFHSITAARLLDTVSHSEILVPFSWVAARTFNAFIILIAVSSLLLLHGRVKWASVSKLFMGLCLVFFVLGYLVIQWCISSDSVPKSIYPNDLVKRPFDVIPLVVYIFAGAFIFPKFKKRFPSIFADSLILSVVPAIALELHMVFGSGALFDSHFNAAHFLKVVFYLVPAIGLLLDYYNTYYKDRAKTEQLHATYRELEARTSQLMDSNKHLEKINKYKSEFMASMSHELRTPLNSVIGFSRILLKDFGEGRNPRGYRAVEAIFRNSTHLLGLINDILDLSRIEAGRMSINKSDFFISELVSEVKHQLEPLAEEKRLEINLINYARNIVMVSDQVKLKQILLNLCSNAIKYTERGSVTISVERDKESSLGPALKISVKDTGIGIAEAEKEKLFTEFGRAKEVQQKEIEGTGLGLLISAKLTELLGGYIEFDSEYGVGSEFRVYFPVAELEERIESGQWDRKGLCVVLVDDDVDMLRFYEMALKDSGIKVYAERNFNAAIKLCDDVLPDVICFDAAMPANASSIFLRELFNHRLMKDVPKIALSSNDEVERAILAEGADRYLAKPCDPEEFAQQVFSVCRQNIDSILIVGADDAHMVSLSDELESFQMEASFCDSSEMALDKLKNYFPGFVVINLGNQELDCQRLMISLLNDEHLRKIPQVLYNGMEQQRKLTFGNDAQEELALKAPSLDQLFNALYTLRRRCKNSLLRIHALNKSLTQNSQAAVVVAAVEAQTPDDKREPRVLVVEDSKDNRELMDWILDDADIAHDCASTGREALKRVMQYHYSMLILDIHLPDLGGCEVARRLRATNSYRTVPIVAVTANTSAIEQGQLQACGITALVTKPIEQDKLLNEVRRHLNEAT